MMMEEEKEVRNNQMVHKIENNQVKIPVEKVLKEMVNHPEKNIKMKIVMIMIIKEIEKVKKV